MASRAELARRNRKRGKARQRVRAALRAHGITLSPDGKSATYTDERGTYELNVPGTTQIPGGPTITIGAGR